MIGWWLLAAALLPVAQDEAYYFLWARHLAFGYFDHPPLVALMAQTAHLLPGSAFVARLGTVLVAAGQLVALLGLLRAVGLTSPRARVTAFLLATGNVLGFVFGFLTTPDTVLIFAWTLALRETAYALGGQPRRWLTAGGAAGIGLLAKYTMGLYLFVAAWALLAEWRRAARGDTSPRPAIKTPWPWAGALVALLVFSPHLAWNAAHDWITIRFQLRHGFALDRPAMDGKALPPPLPELEGSTEDRLAAPFRDVEEATKKEERRPGPFDPLLASLNRYVGFYASQLAIWGATLPLAFVALRRRRRDDTCAVAPHARALAQASAFVPLVVFGLISLGSKVEANWSGMYVIGAALLLAPYLAPYLPRLRWAVAINAALLLTALVHARTGILPTRPHRDRVLKETHGYDQLARQLADLQGAPVFADSFQITAMSRFHAPGLTVRQWPGITRDSEFVRNPQLSDLTVDDLQQNGSFWLVTTNLPPPRLAGFSAEALTQLRDCKHEGLQQLTAELATDVNKRCKRPVHEWYLVRYRTDA